MIRHFTHLGVTSARLLSGAARPALALGLAMAMATGAHAQTSKASDDADKPSDQDIIVTGTLIRGVAPTGAAVVSVTAEAVQATGASNTAQLLQSVPQLGFAFNALQFPPGGNVTINRPNLRNLPGFNTAGGSTTLVMMDGHRMVGMGVSSTTPDPDVIPPGAIERLEVVPDGGSAIYGSDAVAGVMNFITRKNLNGLELNGRTGFADSYMTWDVNGTVGHKWDTGSMFLSYAYAQHDALFGRDRDFVRTIPVATPFAGGGPATITSAACSPGNVAVGGVPYALPFTTATAAAARGLVNQCDLSDNASLYPKEHHHAVMAGLNQDLSDKLSFDVRANFFSRRMTAYTGTFNGNLTARPTTAGFAAHQIGAETSQTVYYSFGGTTAARQELSLDTWGLAGTLTYKPFGDWQVRVLGNYGQSVTQAVSPALNTTALNAANTAGLFNPYDPASSNAQALGIMTNYETFGRARQQLINFRAVADGSLFALPGGNAKLAFGTEWIREEFNTSSGAAIPGFEYSGTSTPQSVGAVVLQPALAGLPIYGLHRNVKAAFGELSLPIVSADNNVPLMRELTLSLSGRYDDYSDFGDTFNPKIGFSYRPTSWLRFRGSWGKSFNAPSLADSALAGPRSASYISYASPFGSLFKPPANLQNGNPYPTPQTAQSVLVLGGNAPNIQPQKAKTLSLGVDLDPAFIPGLHLGATFWRISFSNQIGQTPYFSPQLYWTAYARTITVNDGSAAFQTAVQNALAQASVVSGQCDAGFTGPASQCVYAIISSAKDNLGDVMYTGLDFNINYNTNTSFGSVDFALNGTKNLHRKISSGPGQPYVDQFYTDPRSNLQFSLMAGANIKTLRAQVTWNHTGGYDYPSTAPQGLIRQFNVSSFDTVNLFFRYGVEGEGIFKNLAFTLNVDNVLDKSPPFFAGAQPNIGNSGYANGSTLGRLIQFGVQKKF